MVPNSISLTVLYSICFLLPITIHVVVFLPPMHARTPNQHTSTRYFAFCIVSNSISISNFYKFAFRSYIYIHNFFLCSASIFLHNFFVFAVVVGVIVSKEEKFDVFHWKFNRIFLFKEKKEMLTSTVSSASVLSHLCAAHTHTHTNTIKRYKIQQQH